MTGLVHAGSRDGFDLIVRQAEVLASSRIIPAAYRNRAPDVIAAGLAGQAFGWDVMTSLRNYHVIEGTASLRPEAMLGLVRRAGHSVTLTLGDGDEGRQAVAIGRRADTADEHTAIFSEADAKRAGLAGKKNWQTYLDSMLTWRAVSALCRVLYPDVVLGAGYVPEEIGGEVDQVGNPVEPDPFENPVLTVAEAKRRVLEWCGGDRDEAIDLWSKFHDGESPIEEDDLERFLDRLGDLEGIEDAEIVVEPAE